jgi:hypothetical protein
LSLLPSSPQQTSLIFLAETITPHENRILESNNISSSSSTDDIISIEIYVGVGEGTARGVSTLEKVHFILAYVLTR